MKTAGAISFMKLVGTGNDFLFIDFRDEVAIPPSARPEFVARIAHRNTGVGSDGVIFVERTALGEEKLKWDFFNPDGSTAEMCGNALRCMGRWANVVLSKSEITFLTARGDVTVRKVAEDFIAELNFVEFTSQPVRFKNSFGEDEARLINTGVPHAVVLVSSIDDKEEMARAIPHLRFHSDAGPAGANVTFLEKLDAGRVRTVTFERGVEGYTLSCGTGVLAAAAIGAGVGERSSVGSDLNVAVETPGGKLKVVFKKDLASVHLIGPADPICTGVLEERYLR